MNGRGGPARRGNPPPLLGGAPPGGLTWGYWAFVNKWLFFYPKREKKPTKTTTKLNPQKYPNQNNNKPNHSPPSAPPHNKLGHKLPPPPGGPTAPELPEGGAGRGRPGWEREGGPGPRLPGQGGHGGTHPGPPPAIPKEPEAVCRTLAPRRLR